MVYGYSSQTKKVFFFPLSRQGPSMWRRNMQVEIGTFLSKIKGFWNLGVLEIYSIYIYIYLLKSSIWSLGIWAELSAQLPTNLAIHLRNNEAKSHQFRKKQQTLQLWRTGSSQKGNNSHKHQPMMSERLTVFGALCPAKRLFSRRCCSGSVGIRTKHNGQGTMFWWMSFFCCFNIISAINHQSIIFFLLLHQSNCFINTSPIRHSCSSLPVFHLDFPQCQDCAKAFDFSVWILTICTKNPSFLLRRSNWTRRSGAAAV